jgi:hypothetical protein
VRTAGGEEIYFECTVVGGDDDDETKDSHVRRLKDYVNQRLSSPDYFLSIEVVERGSSSIPLRRLRDALDSWLKGLDYKAVLALVQSHEWEKLPRYGWDEDDWELIFRPFPRNKTRGGDGRDSLGMHEPIIRFTDPVTAPLRRLRKKGQKYGRVDRPLVIALNNTTWLKRPDLDDLANTALGREGVLADPNTMTARGIRYHDGLWMSDTGPQYTRISGVLFGIDFTYWTVSTATLELWHNPWSTAPLPTSFWGGDKVIPKTDGTFSRQTGRPVHEIYGVAYGWPFPYRE